MDHITSACCILPKVMPALDILDVVLRLAPAAALRQLLWGAEVGRGLQF
jgi:hypothetical protein